MICQVNHTDVFLFSVWSQFACSAKPATADWPGGDPTPMLKVGSPYNINDTPEQREFWSFPHSLNFPL